MSFSLALALHPCNLNFPLGKRFIAGNKASTSLGAVAGFSQSRWLSRSLYYLIHNTLPPLVDKRRYNSENLIQITAKPKTLLKTFPRKIIDYPGIGVKCTFANWRSAINCRHLACCKFVDNTHNCGLRNLVNGGPSITINSLSPVIIAYFD